MIYENLTAEARNTFQHTDDRRFNADHVCPNCRARGMWEFYRTTDVPVHTCLMLSDVQTASAFPRRPISLAFCRSCGFVSNTIFDRNVHEYAARYEDQQSFSGRFRQFQTELIERLINTYQLKGKCILEIGCGKGDFLVELCRRAGAQGVGIDPRCSRTDGESTGNMTFLPERFGPQHRQLAFDFVCCRHTLEHLPDTERFIALLRDTLNGKPDARVFFEVPDAGRVWRERAFWDVNYEHCSYFTAGSLAEVFRRNRFEVLEADLVFGKQYLILVAQPVESRSHRRVALEETPTVLEQELVEFSMGVKETISRWREHYPK